MNFAALDLNLLRVFDAMMQEGSTVRAGDRIGLSQPAVSSAIGRLRHITGDTLFVRDGNRMVPTPRAVELHDPVRSALAQIEEALSKASGFDPARSERTFRIIGSDYFSSLLMPQLAAAVAPVAPSITFQMLDHASSEIAGMLSDGKADMAVGPAFPMPEWIGQERLHDSYIVSLTRRDHPVMRKEGIKPGGRIPPEIFCRIPQVFMSMDGSLKGTMDAPLSEQGLTRTIAMTAPHFQAVALCVAESDLLGNLPIHFARRAARLLGLELYLPPFDPPILGTRVFWHKRFDADPANLWLRNRIAEALDLGTFEAVPEPPVS